jgi:hypothetical protein
VFLALTVLTALTVLLGPLVLPGLVFPVPRLEKMVTSTLF